MPRRQSRCWTLKPQPSADATDHRPAGAAHRRARAHRQAKVGRLRLRMKGQENNCVQQGVCAMLDLFGIRAPVASMMRIAGAALLAALVVAPAKSQGLPPLARNLN